MNTPLVNNNHVNNAQTTGLKRKTIDKFYTSETVVKECMKIIDDKLEINKSKDICIEPSAGNGAFIKGIKTVCDNCKFYDIEPEHVDITQQDFLKLDMSQFKKKGVTIHCIGNPPFGRQSSLSIKFIKHCATYCDTISFILPKSFKKESLRKHFPLDFHLIHEYDIPEEAFLVNGKTHNVPCVFQIWVKKTFQRPRPTKLIPIHFKFVKKNMDHDISFRRVGVNAGVIDTQTEHKSFQSHYFIKFKDVEVNEELLENIKNIHYDNCEHTVGPKSISKQELIKEFNKLLLEE
tara:strand:- start:54 stop:926 length:873 start_codon:yes stop_codon:yes gene_type:complete